VLFLIMAYRSFGRFRQASTRLDTPPFSHRHHPVSVIARWGLSAPLGPSSSLVLTGSAWLAASTARADSCGAGCIGLGSGVDAPSDKFENPLRLGVNFLEFGGLFNDARLCRFHGGCRGSQRLTDLLDLGLRLSHGKFEGAWIDAEQHCPASTRVLSATSTPTTRPATSGAVRITYACTTACDDKGVNRSITIDKANSRMVTATTMSAALRSGLAESVSAGAGFAGMRSSTAILLVVSDSVLIKATRVWQAWRRC
jgi:hypothetical protein